MQLANALGRTDEKGLHGVSATNRILWGILKHFSMAKGGVGGFSDHVLPSLANE